MVSSKDVARRAGVSQSTVSRVLNQPMKVRPETYRRVMKAMKELNYRPNQIARSLVQNKTKTIGLIAGPLHNPFYADTTMAIINKSTEKGYQTLVCFDDKGDNIGLYESFLSYRVDGLILSSILIDDPIYDELEKLNVPFVMFNRRHRKGGNYVELDNEKAAALLTEHLLSLNHRRIAYIGGPKDISTFLGRYNGFVKTMEAYGFPIDESLIKETDTSEQDVIRATEEILNSSPPCTAILASTDSMAIFCFNYLLEKGIRVPDDISLCGIDNIEITSHQAFQLTTAGCNSNRRMGELAIERLLQMMESEDVNKEEPLQITLSPDLYIRKTTAPI